MAAIRLDVVIANVRTLLGEEAETAPGSTRTTNVTILNFLKMVLWERNTTKREYFDGYGEGTGDKSVDNLIGALEYTPDADGNYPIVPINVYAAKVIVSEVYTFLQIRDQTIIRPEQALLQERQQRQGA